LINLNSNKHLPAATILVSVLYAISFSLRGLALSLDLFRSILGFIILTYLLGATLRIFLKTAANLERLPPTLSIAGATFDVLLSIMLNVTLSGILIKTFSFCETNLVAITVTLIIILNVFTLHRSRRKASCAPTNTATSRVRASLIIPWAILLVSSLLFAACFRDKTPFPAINGWDMNSASAYINWIISHNGFQYLLVPPVSGVGPPYPAPFFYLVASYSLFLGIEPYMVFWSSVYALIFGYMSLVYLLALRLSKDKWLSLTSAFIAFFTSAACAEVVRTPLYLTLDMTAQIIFLLILDFNIYYGNYRMERGIMSFCAVVFLALFNYFTVIAVFPILLWAIMRNKRLPTYRDERKVLRIFVAGILSCIIVIIVLSNYAMSPVSSFYSRSIFANFFGPLTPPALSTEILQMIYPFYLWFILALVTVSVVLLKTLGQDTPYLPVLLYVFYCLGLCFLPTWFGYRFEFYLRVFVAVSVSGLSLLLYKIRFRRIGSAHEKLKGKTVSLGSVASFLLLLIIIVQMYPLFTNYASNFYALTSKDEYYAAVWIRDNTPSDSYILTDPGSGYVIRGLALRNASSSFILADGRMPADPSSIFPNVRTLISSFFTSRTFAQASVVLENFTYTHIYVVVTTRTAVWVRSPPESIVTAASENEDLPFFGFVDPQHFELVRDFQSVRIYLFNQTRSLQTPSP